MRRGEDILETARHRYSQRLNLCTAHCQKHVQLCRVHVSQVNRFLPPKPSVARHCPLAENHGLSEFDTSVDGVEVRLSLGERQGQVQPWLPASPSDVNLNVFKSALAQGTNHYPAAVKGHHRTNRTSHAEEHAVSRLPRRSPNKALKPICVLVILVSPHGTRGQLQVTKLV